MNLELWKSRNDLVVAEDATTAAELVREENGDLLTSAYERGSAPDDFVALGAHAEVKVSSWFPIAAKPLTAERIVQERGRGYVGAVTSW
jgi:hypothetical protein